VLACGQPPIAPEHLLSVLLSQIFNTFRRERLLAEQFDYDLLFGCFVGMNVVVVWTTPLSAKTESDC
jgi:transposase